MMYVSYVVALTSLCFSNTKTMTWKKTDYGEQKLVDLPDDQTPLTFCRMSFFESTVLSRHALSFQEILVQ
jgi:hypothetical protein